MEKFRTGNVVKTVHGYLVIVSSVRKDTVSWVSFCSSGSSGTSFRDDKQEKREWCSVCEFPIQATGDCPSCGEYNDHYITEKGFDRSEVLANNVQSYIMSRLTKNFDF